MFNLTGFNKFLNFVFKQFLKELFFLLIGFTYEQSTDIVQSLTLKVAIQN